MMTNIDYNLILHNPLEARVKTLEAGIGIEPTYGLLLNKDAPPIPITRDQYREFLRTKKITNFYDPKKGYLKHAKPGPCQTTTDPQGHGNLSHKDNDMLQNEGINKEAISKQLVNNKEANKGTIGKQLVNNKEAELSAKSSISKQLVGQLVSRNVNNKETIGKQLVSKKALFGNEEKILRLIFNDIKFSGENISSCMSLDYFSQSIKTTKKTVKTTISRLVAKGYLERVFGKRGKGGHTQFSIKKEVYKELVHDELVNNKETIGKQLGSNWEANWEANREAAGSSSSISNYINNINTTTTSEDLWNLVQTPQLLKDLGLGKNHIDQIKSKFALSPEEVSKSLEAFAFDLANGELERLKTKNINPINYFFGAIKQGGYCPVNENFKTAEELAQEEMIERLKKKREVKQKRTEELRELLFEEWLESKTTEELCNIAKPVGEILGQFHKVDLKSYFLETEFERIYLENKIQ